MCNDYPELVEVVELANEINAEFPEWLSYHGFVGVEVVYTTYGGIYLKALGVVIWSEDNDLREYCVDEQGHYTEHLEDLKGFVKRELSCICKGIMEGLE